ncbi:MAG TPA: histidine phosphatase family protein [Acidimicrobiales bacterium]|nr:histidine phosphatase family protein [Acidimicrobiales bacterium]
MAIHLVRHADAGSRPHWSGDDEQRPLIERGLRQASAIADLLAPRGVGRILTSRYVRCVETVEPLATKLGIAVEEERAIAEEASITDAWALIEELLVAPGDAVLCSHGNILSPILDRLHRRGFDLVADELSCRKGSVWTIECDGEGQIERVVQVAREA